MKKREEEASFIEMRDKAISQLIEWKIFDRRRRSI